jgi:hypothetical protein
LFYFLTWKANGFVINGWLVTSANGHQTQATLKTNRNLHKDYVQNFLKCVGSCNMCVVATLYVKFLSMRIFHLRNKLFVSYQTGSQKIVIMIFPNYITIRKDITIKIVAYYQDILPHIISGSSLPELALLLPQVSHVRHVVTLSTDRLKTMALRTSSMAQCPYWYLDKLLEYHSNPNPNTFLIFICPINNISNRLKITKKNARINKYIKSY